MHQKKLYYRGKELDTTQPGWYKEIAEEPVNEFLEQFLNDQTSFRVSTSGSTGIPKTIEIQKQHMRASARKTVQFLGLKPKDTSLLCLPVEKIAGIMMLVRWLEGCLDLHPVEPTSQPLEKEAGNFRFSAMVPLQVKNSLTELQRVKKLIIGGGPVDAELEQRLRPLPGDIFHTYGMTETISHVAMRRINGEEAQDFFQAIPGVSFALDERKCLVITAPDIGVEAMPTNDVVELLDDQRFLWVGRADNVVNSGGVKLHPELLEQKLGDADFGYFLAGMPDQQLGEKLVMLVDRKAIPHQQQLRDFLQDLEGYERPREVYAADFYYAVNGKLQRKKILRQGDLKKIS